MAVEEQFSAFYNDILAGKSYFDMRRSIQICVADYIAQVWFGKDFKRVVYTNPEFAFRKRIEALANGIDENIFISNLQLPFASFYITSAPKITKSVSASEWSGYYDEVLDQRIHFTGILQDVKVQFYFHRSDDATVAHQIALFESHSGAPVRYIDDVYWRDKVLKLPVWITIKKITAGNESFDESRFLEQNHMYAMTLDLEVESTQVHIHRGLNAVQLPFKWHATGNIDTWEENEKEYYTQKCVLMWAKSAWGADLTPCYVDPPKSEDPELYGTLEQFLHVPLVECDEKTLKQIESVLPNNATAEMVEGYFSDDVRVDFNRLKYNEEKTTIDEKGEVTAWIDIVIKKATHQFWASTEVLVPSRDRDKPKLQLQTCHDTYIQIDGLHPNSTYTVFFISRDINGNFKTIPLEFTTPKWAKEKLPVASDTGNVDDLLLMENTEEPPEVVHPRGLIGLEL